MGLLSRFGLTPLVDVRRIRRTIHDRLKWLWRAPMAALNRRPAKFNVYLQTTSLCNGQCLMCPYVDSWHKENPGRMSDELFERLMTQLAPMPIDWYSPNLQCEPTLDPQFLPRLRTAIQRLNFRLLFLATNASVISESMARPLLDLLEPVNHELWISFHAVNPGQYHRIMGLDYDRVMANIVGLLKMSQDRKITIAIHGAGAPLPGFSQAPFHFSQREYQAFWNGVFEQYGIVRRPAVAYFPYHDRAGEVHRPDYAFHNYNRSLLGSYCMRADEWLHVLYNGDVIFCCNDYHRRTVIGNVMRTPVEQILSSPTYRDYRLRSMGLRPVSPDFLCRTCAKPGYSMNWLFKSDVPFRRPKSKKKG